MDIRIFFVTQDRDKSTDSVEGATAQESIDSVERPTTHSVTSSRGRSGSTQSGGAAHHKFCTCNFLLLCTPMCVCVCVCVCTDLG